MGARHTPRAKWALSVPYFDGRCEMVINERGDRAGGRCRQAAIAVSPSGFAICRQHAVSKSDDEPCGVPSRRFVVEGFDPGAIAFRCGPRHRLPEPDF